MSVLMLEGVGVAYRGASAVTDVSLALSAGGVLAVIGPNGAGKTSLLHAVMGVIGNKAGVQGRVRLDGRDVSALPVQARVALGLVLVPERRELFASMTVEDNVLLGGWRHRAEGRAALLAARDAQYVAFPRLAERARQSAGTLSGGERQMLAMARAMMARPRVLLLDEPSLGLAPLIVRDIFAGVSALAASGVAVLVVEQNARAALAVAAEALVLEAGRVTLRGPSATLAADPRVAATYLGAISASSAAIGDGAPSASAKLNPG